jgi:hypothetical protein
VPRGLFPHDALPPEQGVAARVLIPTIATTHSNGSRPTVPIDRDQGGAGAEGAVGRRL